MKKITFLLLVLLTSVVAQATDLTGIKIYVNPGHGGYDSDDRSVWTIPVPEVWTNPDGYWESKSNLVKGLALKEMLEAAGASVIISRTENRSADDRSLSEIAAEANANNVDHFLSIHSNAMGSSNSLTNYLLLLYHGYDNQPTVAASLPMVQSAGPILQNNPLTVWQNSSPSLRGDFTFYGNPSGLGVLRPLTVPGFLSEGSFHDYAPETHRLCNNDYCKLEAMRLFHHFHNYFQRDMPTAATIAGWVKSENERVDVLNAPKFVFRSNTDDQWKPINGASVTLLDEGGQTLQTYTTDDWYNGVFVFYNLTAGKYKVRVEATGYESKTVDVTATSSDIAYAKVKLFNPDYAINSDLEPDYPQPDQDAGAVVLDHYDFVQQGATATFDALNSASIRRILFRNNKFYVLTTDPAIRVYNAETQALLGELDLTGIEGGNIILSDIAFAADGKLLACNQATVALPETAGNYFKVYKWDNDTAAPALLFQSQKQGNWSTGIVGETFATAGASDHLKVYTTAVTTGSSKQIRIVAFEYLAATNMLSDKYMGSADAAHNGAAIYTEAEWGAHPKFTISPSGSGDHLIIDSDEMQATEYQFDWEQLDRYPLVKKAAFATTEAPVAALGNTFARYADRVLMAAPVCNADASEVGVVLYDVTAGLDNAVKLSDKYPGSGLGSTPAGAMQAGIVVDGYDIELIILAQKQGTARYKTEQNPVANIYASEISYTDGAFHFTLNENATAVTVEIYDEGEWVQTYNVGALAKGVHRVDNPFGGVSFDSYGITATAHTNIALAKISTTDVQFNFFNLRGVAVDNTPTSPFFGRVYASEAGGGAATGRTTQDGIYILNAALQDITNQGASAYAGNVSWSTSSQASPFRPATGPDGQVYITDWSDTSTAGIWVMDPANPTAAFRSVFGGSVGSTGLATANGTAIHGSISDCKVLGTGEDMTLYTFDEDLVAAGKSQDPDYIAGGNLFQYNIGSSTTPWITAPSSVVYDDVANGNLQKNGNSQIAPDGRGGWWISQYRATDDAGTPSLIHVNTATSGGTVDFVSGRTPSLIGSSYQGGMAVTVDGARIAMGTTDKVMVFDIAWDGDGKPSLSLVYTISNAGSSHTYGLAFDVVGNLYIAVPKSLMVYSFPKVDNSYTTRKSVDRSTGILPPEVQSELIVYPNPVISELTIDGQGILLKAYTLYDLNGRLVHSGKIDGSRHTISTGGWNPGVYILQIQTSQGTIVKRIIKNGSTGRSR
jgi:N-acetylmuramoyl-L-alanine amidase